ncbi:hypothetical protein [Vreelandella sp. EE27]
MVTLPDAEQRFAAQASLHTRRARQAALNSGQTLIEIVDGNFVRVLPNGEVHILKKAPAKHKVSMGTKLKVT